MKLCKTLISYIIRCIRLTTVHVCLTAHICLSVKYMLYIMQVIYVITPQVKLLKNVLEAWKREVEKKPPEMSVDQAYDALGLETGVGG